MKEKEDVQDTVATAEEAALVDQFAAFAKSYFIYPANNARVQDALSSFLDAFTGYSKELKALEISVRRDHLRSASGRLDSRKPVLSWFRDCLIATTLAGLRLDHSMTKEGLLSFMGRLQENRARREREKHADISFAEFWPEQYPGILLQERSFVGGYHENVVEPTQSNAEGASVRAAIGMTAPQSAVIADGVEISAEVLAKVGRVEKVLKSKGLQNAPEMSMDLLSELMRHLPAEALADPAYATGKLAEILDEVEPIISGLVMRSAPTEGQKVTRILASVVEEFFGSLSPGPSSGKPHSGVSVGRPGDDLVADDVAAFLKDLEQLPGEEFDLDASDPFIDAEALGACLHRLSYCPREASARTIYDKLEQMLRNPDEETQRVLATYTDMLLGADSDRDDRKVAESVFEHLRRSDLLTRIRDLDCFRVDALSFSFPVGFLLYLDSLDERKKHDREELQDLCTRIGDERIRREEPALTQDGGVLRADRASKIMACATRDVLPMVRIIARHADRALRPRLVSYLLRLDIDRPEVAALRVVEPPDRIPQGYVLDICEGELNHGNYKPNVKEYAGFLIRNYIKDLSEEEEYLERRAYAILSLKDFPGKDTQALLKEQLKGKGPLGMIKPPRAIREAVNDVLAHLRGRG